MATLRETLLLSLKEEASKVSASFLEVRGRGVRVEDLGFRAYRVLGFRLRQGLLRLRGGNGW